MMVGVFRAAGYVLWHDAHQGALLTQCRQAQHAAAVALPSSVVQRMVAASHVLRRDLMQLGHAPLGDWRSLTRCACIYLDMHVCPVCMCVWLS
jgi:hypothetical protein